MTSNMFKFFNLFCLCLAMPFAAQAKKIINKNPLVIEQSFLESGFDTKARQALLLLDLKLAPEHKAYVDEVKFKFSDTNWSHSEIAIDPIYSYKDKFSKGKERMVFSGKAKLRAYIKSKSKKLPSKLNVQLIYQACTEDYCLLPTKRDFEISFPKKLSAEEKAKSSWFDFNFNKKASYWSLIFIYLFGFLTAFSPCVFPMIPITLGILGFSETSNRIKGLGIGFSYALGLSLTYALVGVAAAMTGGFIGQAFTNPYVVWSIFIFYVLTALAMMGVFTIKSPASLDRIFSKVKGTGFVGAFLAGTIGGIIASPCVGPAVAAVVAYVAQSGDPLFGFSALFSYGMGLGSLFILIGLFYGELQSRLKPGPWLNYIKYIMAGLILIGAFLFIKPHLSFLKGSHTHKNASHKLWTPFSDKAYQNALKTNKPIIIDFYADWCTACKELDAHTFSHPDFKAATDNQINLIKFNATKPTEKEQDWLNQFEVYGLPTILFIDHNGNVKKDLTLTGFEPWTEFQKRLKDLIEKK